MLSAEQLLDDARREAGLDDYGEMRFAEGLGVFVKSVNDEAGLKPDRERALRTEIVRVLVNRLRMQDDISRHPEIGDEVVLPPVFITSLPRTGSTKLHRMLAATGDFNALRLWQSYNFAPFPGSNGAGPDPRIEAAERHLQRMYQRAPGFHRYHQMYADEVEEEVWLLDANFNSLYMWAGFLNVPTYVDWVLGTDGLAAFRDLKAQLRYLQWQHYRGMNRRWVFKTPSWFGFEAAYAAVFEGTDFLVAHRHPTAVYPSLCALFCGVRSLYNDGDVSQLAGPAMLHNCGEALKMHLAWRAQCPADKALDIAFEEIVRDEVALTERIYAFLGLEFRDTAKANLLAWLQMDASRGHERVTATLGDFGLTAESVNERMAGYIDRYAAYVSKR
jgi:Sulfotransferase family